MSAAPEKPAFGAPCNGCGFCCASEVCKVGRVAFGDVPAPCPALVFDAGRWWCGLVVLEQHRGDDPLFARTLAIGVGCDTSVEPPPQPGSGGER